MYRVVVDWNDWRWAGLQGRIELRPHLRTWPPPWLRPELRVVGHDYNLQTEGTVEFGEDTQTWWFRPDWSTRRDLPYPLQARADLVRAAAAANRVAIDPERNGELVRLLAAVAIADTREPRMRVILYDDASDVEATVVEQDAAGRWLAAPRWGTRRPRPYPYQIVANPKTWDEQRRVLLEAEALARLGPALAPGLLVLVAHSESGTILENAYLEHDAATDRWWARIAPLEGRSLA